MKKNLFFLIVSIFLAITTNSQERMSDQSKTAVAVGLPLSSIPPCFCCDAAYNLPNPPQINLVGQTQPLCACDPIKFSTLTCPGATFNWTVVDNFGNNIAVTGGNTNAITLNYTLAQQVATQATWISIKLVVCCGNHCVTNTLVVKLKPIPKTNVSFSMSDNGNGVYTATATALCGSSAPSGWTLKEIGCPGPNPCGWVAGSIIWQNTGSPITIPNGILIHGKCYVLTHYVNVCSSNWIAGSCTVYSSICFTLNTSSMKIPGNANDKNDAMPLKPEMLKEVQQIK